jgi:hypothetical protein
VCQDGYACGGAHAWSTTLHRGHSGSDFPVSGLEEAVDTEGGEAHRDGDQQDLPVRPAGQCVQRTVQSVGPGRVLLRGGAEYQQSGYAEGNALGDVANLA